MAFTFGPRRGIYVDIAAVVPPGGLLTPAELGQTPVPTPSPTPASTPLTVQP